ncbi:hypothetical protein FRC12_023177 [Ceratobasidium sp. 428]|nr:hypothetical protein FRC12_023177 [Ceratobasidium sp. 428]
MSAATTPTTTARQAPSNIHPTVEVNPKRSSPVESPQGSLNESKLRSVHAGGVLHAPQAFVVSNDYGEADAPAFKDHPRVREWAEGTDTILVTRVESNADEATVVLSRCF